MNIRIHAEAEAELEDAHQYYLGIDERLSAALLREVARLLAQISSYPLGCKLLGTGQLRRCTLKRFPYVVIYEPRVSEIMVIAFAHAKRLPGYWQDRH
ncbi:type II toxin-antitoxin system RelE/ParE family toxin [Pseudoduganella rivuli]|uniref:type II toxin-antitoxin system RelE/ParE family toxin n=1 Tax=Pseudoduganella rivuli TaxID=2666085 RepID=UPI0012B07EC0